MKYQYKTTVVYLRHEMTAATTPLTMDVSPPDNTDWALLSMTPSSDGQYLFYTWAKIKPLAQFSSSDEDFAKTLELVKQITPEQPKPENI